MAKDVYRSEYSVAAARPPRDDPAGEAVVKSGELSYLP